MKVNEALHIKILEQETLIVLGMHRSGTSLLSRLLVDLGIHMGKRLSRDSESVFFQRLNRKIFRQVDAAWGQVNPLIEALKSENFVATQAQKMRHDLFSDLHLPSPEIGLIRFFGSETWNSFIEGKSIRWGWKDPRTTITFPIWQRVFPNAKFLHLTRNGIDVAISLHRRSLHQAKKIRNRLFPLDFSKPTLDFEYCFQLWETYVSHVIHYKEHIPSDQYYELRYENLLTQPVEELQNILKYIELSSDPDRLALASKRINKKRLNNSTYAMPYRDMIINLTSNPLMQMLGYDYSVDPR